MKKNELSAEQIIDYLKRNKDVLSINAIGKKVGYRSLWHAVTGYKDKDGRVLKLPNKHLPKLRKVIHELTTI